MTDFVAFVKLLFFEAINDDFDDFGDENGVDRPHGRVTSIGFDKTTPC